MEIFGEKWRNYTKKVEQFWKERISPDDLILIPGDISWASSLEEAAQDLHWIHSLPGTKLMIKGNHDFWWPSSKKLKERFPSSIKFIYNTAFHWHEYSFGGSRLWDSEEYSFEPFIEYVARPQQKKTEYDAETARNLNKTVFNRELERLKLSLSKLNPKAKKKVALTHYPPIGPELTPSRASAILEEYGVDICVFGHLHNVKPRSLSFGKARGVSYFLTSCDFIDFCPIKIL